MLNRLPMKVQLSVTPLGASATYTSTGLDVPRGITKIVLYAFTDQTGNVHIDQSRDGSTWRAGAAQALAANTEAIVEKRLILPFFRVRLINGATPQTLLDLHAVLLNE